MWGDGSEVLDLVEIFSLSILSADLALGGWVFIDASFLDNVVCVVGCVGVVMESGGWGWEGAGRECLGKGH